MAQHLPQLSRAELAGSTGAVREAGQARRLDHCSHPITIVHAASGRRHALCRGAPFRAVNRNYGRLALRLLPFDGYNVTVSGAIPAFEQRLAQALASKTIPVALERALPAFRERRLAAFAGDDFAEVQRSLYAMKAAAIERLPDLIDQFTERAREAGTEVHHAATADEACRIVGDIARRNGVKLVVKGKSMVSEEIEINEYLERLGIRAVETDLG